AGAAVRPNTLMAEPAGEGAVATFPRLSLNLGRPKPSPVRALAHYRPLTARYAGHGGILLLVARRGGGEPVGGLLAFPFGRRLFVQATAVRTDDGGMRGGAPGLFWGALRHPERAGGERGGSRPLG